MATVLAPPSPPADPVFRFSVARYHAMQSAGILTASDRVELIRGVIVEKPPINPPHAKVMRKMQPRLSRLLPAGFLLQVQLPITLADSEPEPDFSVVLGGEDDFGDRHPGPRSCALVVEVSDASVRDDRGPKLLLYAAARVPVYWVVNIPDRRVEVYTRPRGGKAPTYRAQAQYAPGQDVPVVVAGQTVGSLPVSELLP